MPLPQIDSVVAKPKHAMPYNAKRKSKLATYVCMPLAVVVLLLVAYGLLICWSATNNDPSYSFMNQLVGVLGGLVVMAAVTAFDYRKFTGMYIVMLVVSCVLILSPHLPIIGVNAMGAQSWIRIGVQVQPGEFAKVTIVLFAASLVARYGGKLNDLREYCKAVGLLVIPFLCIMTQPDLGTGLVYLFIAATTLVMGGAKTKYLLVSLGIFVAAIVCVFALDELLKYQTEDGSTEYRLLKQYQRSRLLVFLNQDSLEATDEGYNLKQAMIAIGSGGLFGKGLGASTQSALGFLPEAPTDFIFCVLAEEFGFVGVVALLGLYIAMVAISLHIARSCDNLFGMLVICAIVGMWMFQILENIGMCCGLMPITGIPLPFVSYGSSFMLVNFAMLGLIGSVYSHENRVGKGMKYATAR